MRPTGWVSRFAALVLGPVLAALAGGCKNKPDDLALAQGEWGIASVEFPEDGELRKLESAPDLVVAIKGTRITISHTKEKGRLSALFALDPTKSPKEVDAPEVFVSLEARDGQDGEEKAFAIPGRGIYKFEGDELVLALAVGNGKDLTRPTEFKPSVDLEKKQTVLVFHLKRK